MAKKSKPCTKGSPVNENKAERFVRESVHSNRVVVFIGAEDPFSMRALSALRRSGVKTKWMTSVVISGVEQEESIRDCFLEMTEGRSVPRVFVKGKFIGGAGDLEFLEMVGELEIILKEAKAYKKQKPL